MGTGRYVQMEWSIVIRLLVVSDCLCYHAFMNKQSVTEGNQYGKLTVKKFLDEDKWNHYWVTYCDCGNKSVRTSKYLLSKKRGISASCGCEKTKWLAKRNRSTASQGGLSNTTEYRIWTQMKTRCFNNNHVHFGRYGGRGISIHKAWLGSGGFMQFLKDMGNRPSLKHTLDRIDNNGNYTPTNCKWSTHKEQCNNRSTSVKYLIDGEKLSVSQIARRKNINRNTLDSYIRKQGWEAAREFYGL